MPRLFEQGLNDPALTDRLASGQAASATKNTTWANIITWLETKLTILATQVTQDTNNRFVTDAEKATWNSSGAFVTSIIEIGDWNMDLTASLPGVLHGATFSKIRRVTVVIRNDLGTLVLDLLDQADISGAVVTGTTAVSLSRETGGIFDNTGYDSTGFNRGWIIIDSIP